MCGEGEYIKERNKTTPVNKLNELTMLNRKLFSLMRNEREQEMEFYQARERGALVASHE